MMIKQLEQTLIGHFQTDPGIVIGFRVFRRSIFISFISFSNILARFEMNLLIRVAKDIRRGVILLLIN